MALDGPNFNLTLAAPDEDVTKDPKEGGTKGGKKTKKKGAKKKKKKVAQGDKPIYPGGPTQNEFDEATPDQKKAMQYQARAWKRMSPRERARQKKEMDRSMSYNKKRKEYRDDRDSLIARGDMTHAEIQEELRTTYGGWTPKKGDRGSGGLGMRTSHMTSEDKKKVSDVFNQRWKIEDAIRRYGEDTVRLHPEMGPIYEKIKEEERLFKIVDNEEKARADARAARAQQILDRKANHRDRREAIDRAQRALDEDDARRIAREKAHKAQEDKRIAREKQRQTIRKETDPLDFFDVPDATPDRIPGMGPHRGPVRIPGMGPNPPTPQRTPGADANIRKFRGQAPAMDNYTPEHDPFPSPLEDFGGPSKDPGFMEPPSPVKAPFMGPPDNLASEPFMGPPDHLASESMMGPPDHLAAPYMMQDAIDFLGPEQTARRKRKRKEEDDNLRSLLGGHYSTQRRLQRRKPRPARGISSYGGR